MAGKQTNDWLRMGEAALYYYKQTGHKLLGRDAIRHWIKSGKDGYDGSRVKLKGERRGKGKGLWFTRKAWVDAFIRQMQGPKFNETV